MRSLSIFVGIILALVAMTSAFYANYGVVRGVPPYSHLGRFQMYGGYRGRYWGDGPGDDFDDQFDNGGYRRHYGYRGWNS